MSENLLIAYKGMHLKETSSLGKLTEIGKQYLHSFRGYATLSHNSKSINFRLYFQQKCIIIRLPLTYHG